MKRGKNVFVDARGSSAIFLIIVFMALLSLAGVIVDAVRIMVAENKVELALEAATRSVLADYDPCLAGDYGIFAVNLEGKREDFERYFLANLQERHEGFSLIRCQVQDLQISGSSVDTLLADQAFRKQLLEYMKYKAPLIAGEGLLDVAKKGNLSQKADFLATGLDLLTVRNSAHEKVARLNSALHRTGQDNQSSAKERLAALQAISGGIFEEIRADCKEYKELLHAVPQEFSTSSSGYSAGRGWQEGESFPDCHDIEGLEREMDGLKDALANNTALLKQIVLLEEELASLSKRDDPDSQERKRVIESLLAEKSAGWKPFPEIAWEGVSLPSFGKEGSLSLAELKNRLGTLSGRSLPETLLENSLGTGEESVPDNQFREGMDSGLSWPGVGLVAEPDQEKARGLLGRASAFIRDLAGMLGELLEEGRDNLYLTCYVLDKYTFATSRTKRDHFFEKGEVEYILWGNKQETANISETFTRIFLLRFTVNTMEAFLSSKVPHYLLRFTEACLQGFEKAQEDMKQIYQGDGVPFCAEVGYSLKYSDYLRLFLLFQDKETQLERMRQLILANIIRTDPDFRLQKCFTLLTGEAEVTVNLWFLPALHLDRIGFSQFREGKYNFTCRVSMGF